MLETASLALENAGTDLASIAGREDVGVFASGARAEYEERYKLDPYHAPVYAAPSSATTMFANRVLYFLNLKGPSITVDTACSTALTALHDHRAHGYGRGEGSVCIVLKSLLNAIRDNDCVRAIVRGIGVNHVGRSQGITLPDGHAQADPITRSYKRAGLDPRDTDRVEAHGTCTERGDQIEAKFHLIGSQN